MTMNYSDWKKEIAQANADIYDIYGVEIAIEECSSRDYEGVTVNGLTPDRALVFGNALAEAAFRARTIEGYPAD